MSTKGDTTRKEIIEECLQLFSVRGYFNTSINDIAKATSLTKGGLYCHFSSKRAIWDAVYEEAIVKWKNIVFKGVKEISDPLERLERFVERDMRDYLGANVFQGGCFFLNSLVELSGQSEEMTKQVWNGFDGAASLLTSWLEEAEKKGILKQGINLEETSKFIIISLNGAAALYAPTRDPQVWKHTINQLHTFIRQLRNEKVKKN